ncbi:MAG: hypothetical protein IPI00_06390 [Flavobacteriales bacterium]|nr:hypothetical protein [Flavobacteriales bacterium]
MTMLATPPIVASTAKLFGRYIRELRHVQDRIADSSAVVKVTLEGIQNGKGF